MTTTERATVRHLIRYAVVMGIVGLLIGISFQESAKKLPFSQIGGGQHLEAVIHLALVHGHVFTLGVLLPLAMAGALVLARKTGGAEVPAWAQRTLTRGYLPFAALSLALQLYKGYHFLLMARAGERNFAVMDDAFMGGIHALRYGIYAAVHSGMGITLGVFLVMLWRSLGRKNDQAV
jgi:hypothetical protein